MDMRVNQSLIRSEREKRAWSQEHLASVTGLGIRTIQRIETTGAASFESARALASVFTIGLADLRNQDEALIPHQKVNLFRRAMIGAATASLVVVVSALVVTSSFAEQIMLDVDISHKDNSSSDKIRRIGRLLTEVDKDAEMRIDDVLRIVIVPTIKDDGRVLLSAKVFEFAGDEYVLLAEPKLITANNKEAEIRIASDSGKSFRFLITPHTD